MLITLLSLAMFALWLCISLWVFLLASSLSIKSCLLLSLHSPYLIRLSFSLAAATALVAGWDPPHCIYQLILQDRHKVMDQHLSLSPPCTLSLFISLSIPHQSCINEKWLNLERMSRWLCCFRGFSGTVPRGLNARNVCVRVMCVWER